MRIQTPILTLDHCNINWIDKKTDIPWVCIHRLRELFGPPLATASRIRIIATGRKVAGAKRFEWRGEDGEMIDENGKWHTLHFDACSLLGEKIGDCPAKALWIRVEVLER